MAEEGSDGLFTKSRRSLQDITLSDHEALYSGFQRDWVCHHLSSIVRACMETGVPHSQLVNPSHLGERLGEGGDNPHI